MTACSPPRACPYARGEHIDVTDPPHVSASTPMGWRDLLAQGFAEVKPAKTSAAKKAAAKTDAPTVGADPKGVPDGQHSHHQFGVVDESSVGVVTTPTLFCRPPRSSGRPRTDSSEPVSPGCTGSRVGSPAVARSPSQASGRAS